MEGKEYNRLTFQLKEVGLSTKQIEEVLQLKEMEVIVESGKMKPELYNKLIDLLLTSSERNSKTGSKSLTGRVKNILKNLSFQPETTSERAKLQSNADTINQDEEKEDKKSSRNLTQFIIGWRKRDVQRMTRKLKKEKARNYSKNMVVNEEDDIKHSKFSLEKSLSKREANGSLERSKRSPVLENNFSNRRIHPIRRMKGRDSQLWNQVTLDGDLHLENYSFSEKNEHRSDGIDRDLNSLNNLEQSESKKTASRLNDPSWKTSLNEIIEYISIHGKTYHKGAKSMVFDDIYNSFYEIHDILPEILLNGKETGYLTYEGNLLVFGKDNNTKIEVNN